METTLFSRMLQRVALQANAENSSVSIPLPIAQDHSDQKDSREQKCLNLEKMIFQLKQTKHGFNEEKKEDSGSNLFQASTSNNPLKEEKPEELKEEDEDDTIDVVTVSADLLLDVASNTGQSSRTDCDQCEKSFTSASQLREHVQIFHLQEKKFECDFCSQKFGRRGGLRRHIQMVHQNHLHKCAYEGCNHPGYKCSKALTAHIRSVHTNVRPFTCEHCSKSFVRKNDLRMHQLTHQTELPFECICGARFRRQVYLKKHQKACSRVQVPVEVEDTEEIIVC